MSHPRVSIIMRTKNSDWVVAQALAGLHSQSFRDFELIVVDSGSTDTTLDIVGQYPCRLIEIEAKSYFPGKVLNEAIDVANGEIVVFQNSDVVPLTPDSLHYLVKAFDDAQVQAAYGRQATRPEAHAWVRRDYESSFPATQDAPPWITLSLPFAAMRKSIWRERGFYKDAWASEDTEWGHWATTHGHAIEYVPEALVMHSHNYTLRQLYGRRFVEGEADAFIYGRDESVWSVGRRACSATLRDWLYAARNGEWSEMPITPLRRWVYHWAYYQGHRLGQTRHSSGNDDASQGQEFILARHEQ